MRWHSVMLGYLFRKNHTAVVLKPLRRGFFILQYSISKSCVSSGAIQRAATARDNVAVVEAKVELELDSAKKELLKTIK